MGRLFPIAGFLIIAAVVVALIDCLSTEKAQVRALPRLLWALLIVFVPLLGALAWLLAGRPRSTRTAGERPRSHPPAPDDDPDVLRGLTPPPARGQEDPPRAAGKEEPPHTTGQEDPPHAAGQEEPPH